MSAPVLLNLSNNLGKRDKMLSLLSIFLLFHKFNKFNIKYMSTLLDSIQCP